MKEYIRLLSDWILSNKYENIPEDVIMQMKILTLDGIACAIHGSKIPLVIIVINAFSEKSTFGQLRHRLGRMADERPTYPYAFADSCFVYGKGGAA